MDTTQVCKKQIPHSSFPSIYFTCSMVRAQELLRLQAAITAAKQHILNAALVQENENCAHAGPIASCFWYTHLVSVVHRLERQKQ